MAVSKLATKYMFENFGAVRWNSRGGSKITTIVVHHAATTNFDSMPGCWRNVEGSAHYGIGQNGAIRAYVDEEKRAWHGNNANDYSIGIEVTNTKGAPNWEVSEASINALVSLIQEIQSRRGKLNIIGHRDCPGANTVCPGPFLYGRLTEIRNRVNGDVSQPNSTGNKNGIAIDNVSKDQASHMVALIQSRYAWTLATEQVKAIKQKDGRYTLVITCDSKVKYEHSVNRLKQELKTHYPTYMQQNIAIVDGDKPKIRIEARNMPAAAFEGKREGFDIYMRKFLCNIILSDQVYGEPNNYGSWDVRIKGEGFNSRDAAVVLQEIKNEGAKKGIKDSHIKAFKY